MHVWAFAMLCYFGIGFLLVFPAPGEPELPDPVFFPESPTTAAPLLVRLSAFMAFSLLFLTPALWVLTIHLATVKKGARGIGAVLFVVGILIGIEGAAVSFDGLSHFTPREWTLGYAGSSGVALAVGGYLIFYSRWIYGLELGTMESQPSTAVASGMRITPNARQIIARLVLFSIVTVLALMVAGAFSVLPQYEEEPFWLTTGFFGVLVLGMVVTGLLKEETLTSLLGRFLRQAGSKDVDSKTD